MSAPDGKVTFASCAGGGGPAHLRRQQEVAMQRENEVEEERDGEWCPRGESAERGKSAERRARYRERDGEGRCIASLLDDVFRRFFILLPNQAHLSNLLEML